MNGWKEVTELDLAERQRVHRAIMQAICEIIAEEDKPLVLKGGTSLLLGYDLDRFSEDLDFDLTKEINGHVNMESVCKAAVKRLSKQGIVVKLEQCKVLKNTETTHRCRPVFSMGEGATMLSIRIEVSSRALPDPTTIDRINGIKVYTVDEIARLKLLAAQETKGRNYRTAARDLHDLAFIADQWDHEVREELLEEMQEFFSNPEYLLERYSSAYDEDSLLYGRLYDDLELVEQWVSRQSAGPSPGM